LPDLHGSRNGESGELCIGVLRVKDPPLLNPASWRRIQWPSEQEPLLLVTIDAEADFDWSKKSRAAMGVSSIRNQRDVRRIFERFSVRPTYMVDYPVSTRPEGYSLVREIVNEGKCEVGAHLQPWDTPPLIETINEYNSYAGNLPPSVEREKLTRLTEVIERNIGIRPRIYRAGRYGIGHATSRILDELGYEIDASIKPGTDLRPWLGPDFGTCGISPYWCGPGSRLLEIPLTIDFTGLAASCGLALYKIAVRGGPFHVPGVLARLHILDRITLTPEGVALHEMQRLTRALLRRGHRIFCMTYHSSSLAVGNTPYVQSDLDLSVFLSRLENYLGFFMGEVGGRPSTPFEVKALARELTSLPVAETLAN
jgi:hypothetical protein